MRFLRAVRSLVSGEVVWRSSVIGMSGASKHEVIVKRTSDGDTIILKTSHGVGQREYMAFECRDAKEVGQALLDGARRCS